VFFLIGGLGPRETVLKEPAAACPACGRPAFRSARLDQYLTLFFIPVLRVRKGTPYRICSACGARDEAAAGWPDRTRACRVCGRRLEADFAFCPRCGARSD
jgi:RNA polymerase subunit RPABC4/transcription elongation factor Spt4